MGPLGNVIPIALTWVGRLSSFRRMAYEQNTAMSARVNRLRRRTPALRALALVTAFALALAGFPPRAQAQGTGGLPLIRDAEIEQLLREYTAPILRAAGLAQQNVHIVIINDRAFNAFVVDGRRIFVNVGALLDAKTPNEIIGVLAHETGHIAGGHLARLRDELRNAQTAAIIAMLIGVGDDGATARPGAPGWGWWGAGAPTGGAKMGPNSGGASIGAAALNAPQS